MLAFKKHYRIRVDEDTGFYCPEVRFLALFWITCAYIDDDNYIMPRGIRCGSRKDAVEVIRLYNKLNCPGREYIIL